MVEQLLKQLDEENPVSRGLLMPTGVSANLDSVKRMLGYVPSWMEAFSATSKKLQPFLAQWFKQKYATAWKWGIRSRVGCHSSIIKWSK